MPSVEQNDYLYAGLLSGGLILGIGAVVLFSDIISTFSAGIELTTILIFRLLLMLLSAYGSASCFIGFFKIAKMRKTMSKKVSEEYEDFILYATPLVEEVIRQRIVGELIIEKLEALGALGKKLGREASATVLSAPLPSWAKFQLAVTLLGTASVGLFVFLEAHPWELVPYSVLILSFLWYLAIAGYFGLLKDQRSYYIPAIFIALLPTASLLLRIVLQQYQVLYVVFIILGIYIFLMVVHFEYLVTGRKPFGLDFLLEEAKKEVTKAKISEEPVEVPEVDIKDLIKDIEAKKKLRMTQVLSEISTRYELPLHEKKIEKPFLSDIIPVWFSYFTSRLAEITWPPWLCRNGKKLSLAGIFTTLLSVLSIFIIPGFYEDFFLETFFLGIVIAVAGYSLESKKGEKVFTWLALPYFAGLLMSLGAIAVFFHLMTFPSLEELQDIALMYVLGLSLMVLNMLMEYKFRIRFYPEISEQGMKLNQQKARWLIKTMRKNVNRARL